MSLSVLAVRSRVTRDRVIDVEIRGPTQMLTHHTEPPFNAAQTVGMVDNIPVSVRTIAPDDVWSPVVFYIQTGGTGTIHEMVIRSPSFERCYVDSICSICRDPTGGDVAVHPSACTHVAHRRCLGSWLAFTCPECRARY